MGQEALQNERKQAAENRSWKGFNLQWEQRPKHEDRIQMYLFSACACDELFYLHIWAAEFHS